MKGSDVLKDEIVHENESNRLQICPYRKIVKELYFIQFTCKELMWCLTSHYAEYNATIKLPKKIEKIYRFEKVIVTITLF